MACAISPAPDAFASGLLSYLDCQAVTLGAGGYQALAAPGSSVSLLLTALLAIFIALIGYRMLFGEGPTVREAVLSVVKIGVALAFATSWPAYRTMVFDVVLRAPADLAAEIGRPAGLPGAAGGLAARMDGTDRAFRILAIYGVGIPTRQQVEAADGIAPPLFANFDMFALGVARVVFLVGSLGAFALLRLSAGLLLALGPLFIAFLLFAATRGLAEGWLRALVAATLGSSAVAVTIGIELALLEPWLSDLVTRRASGVAIPGIPVAILATAAIFALATAGLLALISRIAFTVAVPAVSLSKDLGRGRPERVVDGRRAKSGGAITIPAESRSRASAVADSIVSAQRREERAKGAGLGRADAIGGNVLRGGNVRTKPNTPTPLGQGFRRRTAIRGSGSAIARDRRA